MVDEKNKGKAKIVLKDSLVSEGNSSGEWEITLEPSEFMNAVDMIDHLGLPGKRCRAWQQRHNYLFEGVEIALKYSDYWEYHAELEVVVDDVTFVPEAEQKMREIAERLGLDLMSEEEVADFTKAFEDAH